MPQAGRSFEAFGAERLDVKAFGAVGDGVTDDTQAFQDAIDRLNADGGGSLFVPRTAANEYLLDSAQIEHKANVRVVVEEGVTINLRATVSADRRWKWTGNNIGIIGGTWDGGVTTPTGLQYGSGVSSILFDNSPEDSKLTSNSTMGGEGISGITIWGAKFTHSGGYSLWLKDCTDVVGDRPKFENCRPHYFGSSSGDMNYGGWTGGAFFNGNTGCKRVTFIGAEYRRMSGNCFWMHSTVLTDHHEDFKCLAFTFDTHALDGFMIGNVKGGEFSGTSVRGGMTHQTDSDAPVDAYLSNKYSVAFDMAGYAEDVVIRPTVRTFYGGAVDLDGGRNITVLSPQISDGKAVSKGIQTGDTNVNGGGYGVNIIGGNINDCYTNAIVLNQAEKCNVIGVGIKHPATATGIPMELYSTDERTKNNVVTGCLIEYTASNYCVAETGGGFDATCNNRVYGNHITGTNDGEFLPDGGSTSIAYALQHDVWQPGGGVLPFTLDPSNDRVGLNVVTPGAMFDAVSLEGVNDLDFSVSKDASWCIGAFTTYSNASASHAGQIRLRRSRGSIGSPSIVSSGDQVGSFNFAAYDGAAFTQRALISAFVNGSVSSGNVPMRLAFQTGASSTAERANMDETGTWHIGLSSAPADTGSGATVQVAGFMEASTGFYSPGTASDTFKALSGGGTAKVWISVRNDGDSGFVLSRSSATARDWGLGINSSGQFIIRDRTGTADIVLIDQTTQGVAAKLFNSTATGSTIGLQVNGGNWQVDGNGNQSMAGELNATGAYKRGGSTVINTSNQFVGAGALCGASGIGAGAFNPWNGSGYDTGATGTITLATTTSITVKGGVITGWT